MVDFASIAAVSADELPKVPKMPAGTYIWAVNQLPSHDPARSGNGVNVNFELLCVGPVDPFDGDLDEVAEFDEKSGGIEGATRNLNFYIPAECPEGTTPQKFAAWEARAVDDLRTFLQDHLQVAGDNINEWMSNCLGHQCLGTIAHVPSNRKDKNSRLIDSIERTAPLPE